MAYEYALHRAHHAADAESCGFEILLDPTTRVGLHPSVRRLELDYDIAGLHAAAVSGEDLPEIHPLASNYLVGRSADDSVIHIRLTSLEARFLTAIAREASLTSVMDQLDPSPQDATHLQTLLAKLVQHGLLIAF